MMKQKEIVNRYKAEKSVTRGVVADYEDPEGLNRVKVYIPTIHGTNEQAAEWCVCGLYAQPEIGDIVIVTFDNDDTRVPMVVSNVSKSMQGDSTAASGGTFDISTASSNSDLISLIGRILKMNECGSEFPDDSHYGTVLANDNGGVSVGLIGWHEDNARAIFKAIKEKSPSTWGQTKLSRTLEQSWSGYIPNGIDTTKSGGPTGECETMYDLLITPVGKSAQDDDLCKYVSMYISDALELGMKDIKCIMYYSDFANQACNAAKRVVKSLKSGSISSLDKFHNAIYNYGAWPAENSANKRRRKMTYDKILEMEKNGDLDKLQTVISSTGSLLWPAPGYPVVAYGFGNKNLSTYGRWHPGIDINSTGRTASVEINGQPVVACCNGSVVKGTESASGNYIRIKKSNEEMYCYYFHLSGFASSLGSDVIVGQTIGYVGSTGNSTGPHLHFEVRNGSSSSGSRTESNHGSLVDPELYLLPDGQTGSVTTSGEEAKKVTKTKNVYKAKVEFGNEQNDTHTVDLTYVSRYTGIGSEYAPEGLSAPTKKCFDEMKKYGVAQGIYEKYFNIINGYRSYKSQSALYNATRDTSRSDIVSAPGHSEHQLGEAVDIYSLNLTDWETTGALQFIQWLKDNAHNYGFIIRYPEGQQAACGYDYKPWHLRYVGKEIATKLHDDTTANGVLENILVDASN